MKFSVTVLPGDGIGCEVMPLCLELLQRAQSRSGGDFTLDFSQFDAGAAHYQATGVSLPDEAMDHARNSHATLLAAMGLPSIRYPDGREIAPQLELRERLDLFAGVRPVRTFPGLPLPLGDSRATALDFVLVRESTEGLFASRENFRVEGEDEHEVAFDTQRISRRGCARVFDFACRLAQSRKASGHRGRVTCIDKANVLGSFYFMRQIFDERVKAFPDLQADHVYVDAAALQMVTRPWEFDVAVTENMFGDILSDLGAGLMGGMGMAPSADIGEHHAVFQPCHGSAPDIVGMGKANPTAMFLSAALMLEWLGDRHECHGAILAAQNIRKAVEHSFAPGTLLPCEMGGNDGTVEISSAIFRELDRL